MKRNDIAEKEGDRKRGKVDYEPKKSKAAEMAERFAQEIYGGGNNNKWKRKDESDMDD